MTETLESADVDTHLSDLDTLDDTHRHASCNQCGPRPGNGEVFTAWCGLRAIWLGYTPTGEWNEPPDACRTCATLPACATAGHPA